MLHCLLLALIMTPEVIVPLDVPTAKEKEVLADFPHEYEKAYRKILLTIYYQRKTDFTRSTTVQWNYLQKHDPTCWAARAALLRTMYHVPIQSKKVLEDALLIGPPVPLVFPKPIGVGSCARTKPQGEVKYLGKFQILVDSKETYFVRSEGNCYLCTGVREIHGQRVYVIDALPLEDVTWMYRGKK